MTTARPAFDSRATLAHMGESIRHRGPDAGGIWTDDGIGLCHRRLSIIDLSETGAQPMASPSGRYQIAYNGEIYNYRELRGELEADGVSFRGQSDTEVLVALYEKLGPSCLARLNGMFAIAIWDTQERRLFLARDRLGKKPIYLYRTAHMLAFASEIKALRCIPGVELSLRHDAVKDFFFYQYVPDPKSIYNEIDKLPPAHWLMATGDATIELRQRRWWDVSFAGHARMNRKTLEDDLYALLEDCVRLRMVADVPLGAFLSGGIDSSAMVGMMAGLSDEPITTCSIGFNSPEYDEVDEARALAAHFGTSHHEFTVDSDIAGSVQSLATHFDEPFADPSFVPTYEVSRLARQRVTVALSGDGGDESFAGYQKYVTDQLECRLRALLPASLRSTLSPAAALLTGLVPSPVARRGASLLDTLAVDADEGFYRSNCFFDARLWDTLVTGRMRAQIGRYDPGELTRELYHTADTDEHLGRILYTDLHSYLPGDVLVKVDRMSMAASLETRAPLLDYRIVELAASMPGELKLRGDQTKAILRDSLQRLLPANVFERRKRGFSVPLAHWLRHDLKPLAEARLFARNSGLSEVFDRRALNTVWERHQSGARDHSSELWSCLIFELWWQGAMSGARPGAQETLTRRRAA